MSFHTKEQMNAEYYKFAKGKQPTDICWTWRERENGIGIMNYEEVAQQVALWNKSADIRVESFNNNTVNSPDGKTWYALVIQVIDKKTGEFDEEANPMGAMCLLLFGVMCGGYTYCFETPEVRDAVFLAVQTKSPMPKNPNPTLARPQNVFHPICCLCGGLCECPYGNNPFPLRFGEMRCCNKCNRSAVIPARMKNTYNCETLKMPEYAEDKADLLEHCRQTIEEQYTQYEQHLIDENNLRTIRIYKCNPADEKLLNDPANAELKENYDTFWSINRANAVKIKEELMTYATERMERQIKVRSFICPEDICLTIRSVLGAIGTSTIHANLILGSIVLKKMNELHEAERQRLEEELCNDFSSISSKGSVKQTAKQSQAQATRKANKSNAEKKKEAEEFARKANIAEEKRKADQKAKQIKIAKAKKANILKCAGLA